MRWLRVGCKPYRNAILAAQAEPRQSRRAQLPVIQREPTRL